MRKLDIFSFADVFEWSVISISSTSLIVAIIVLILKRRRLGGRFVRPLHVRTVVYYHNEPFKSPCQNVNAENRPIVDKAGCHSNADQDEGNMCYIDISGEIKRGK